MQFNIIDFKENELSGQLDMAILSRDEVRRNLQHQRKYLRAAEEQLTWFLETEGDTLSQFSAIPDLRKKIAALRTEVQHLENIL